jgi:fructoselysine-6-P-deglycase FrlB-like protein
VTNWPRKAPQWDERISEARIQEKMFRGLAREPRKAIDAVPCLSEHSGEASEPEPRNPERVATSFDVDLEAQTKALLEFDRAPISLGLYPLVRGGHDRIILTGMGGSHLAALPSWRRLVSRGLAAWWIDAGQLLDNPELVTRDSLLVVTSRSGICGEAVALVDRLDETSRPPKIVAITDNLNSPLAEVADCEVLLRSQSLRPPTGFLNALAAHDYLASMILNEDSDNVALTARVVAAERYLTGLGAVARGVVTNSQMRMAYIGFRGHAATALYAGMLTMEVTGIAAESYIGGQFRHGPLRWADENLTAMVFSGRDRIANAASRRLAADLVAAGSTVIVVGEAGVPGVIHIRSPAVHHSGQLAHGVVVGEYFVSALATQASARVP